MKSMFITAAAVGTAIAGLILYSRRKERSQNKITDAAKNAYDAMNEGLGKIERPMHHAMG